MHHASWFPFANFLLSLLGELALLLLAASNHQRISVFLSPLPGDPFTPLLEATVERFTAQRRHLVPANSHVSINTLQQTAKDNGTAAKSRDGTLTSGFQARRSPHLGCVFRRGPLISTASNSSFGTLALEKKKMLKAEHQ